MPEFPLIPASKGFCISLEKAVAKFREVLANTGVDLNGNDGAEVKEAKVAEIVHPDDV